MLEQFKPVVSFLYNDRYSMNYTYELMTRLLDLFRHNLYAGCHHMQNRHVLG